MPVAWTPVAPSSRVRSVSPLPASPRETTQSSPVAGPLPTANVKLLTSLSSAAKSAAQAIKTTETEVAANFILPHVHFVYALGAFVFKLRIRHFLHLADIGNIIPCHISHRIRSGKADRRIIRGGEPYFHRGKVLAVFRRIQRKHVNGSGFPCIFFQSGRFAVQIFKKHFRGMQRRRQIRHGLDEHLLLFLVPLPERDTVAVKSNSRNGKLEFVFIAYEENPALRGRLGRIPILHGRAEIQLPALAAAEPGR